MLPHSKTADLGALSWLIVSHTELCVILWKFALAEIVKCLLFSPSNSRNIFSFCFVHTLYLHHLQLWLACSGCLINFVEWVSTFYYPELFHTYKSIYMCMYIHIHTHIYNGNIRLNKQTDTHVLTMYLLTDAGAHT
jgi:hypothetical protein